MSLGNWLNQPCGSTGRSAWVHRRLSKAGCWPGSGNLPRKDPPPLPPRFHPPPLTRDHSGNFGNEHSPVLSLPATHKWAGCPVHKAGTQDPPSTPVLIFTIMTTMIITMTMILQSDSRQKNLSSSSSSQCNSRQNSCDLQAASSPTSSLSSTCFKSIHCRKFFIINIFFVESFY